MAAMRNKTMQVSALALVGAIGLSGCGGGQGGSDSSGGTPSGSSSANAAHSASYPTQSKGACEVLTRDIAKQAMGSIDANKPASTENANDDIALTTCSYGNDAQGMSDIASATLLMRVAKSADGAKDNERYFEVTSGEDGAQPVKGYGEKAFWSTSTHQLNVLAHHNLYVMSMSSIKPETKTLAYVQKLADRLKDRL